MPITYSHWKSAVNGSFNAAANWSTATAPGASTDAILDAAGMAYTVTSTVNTTIDYLLVAANASLNIAGSSFVIYSAINTFSDTDNAGTMRIGAGGALMFGRSGTPVNASAQFRNTGAVQIGSSGAQASLIFAAPYGRLQGGGTVALSGAAAILGTAMASTLDNRDNTISGSGRIGSANLTFQNDTYGTVSANASAALMLSTGTQFIDNAGVIATTGTGGLVLYSGMHDNGALLAAGSGALTIVNALVDGGGNVAATVAKASIRLSNATLSMGGSISTVAGSFLYSLAGTTNKISGGDVENAGTISIANGSTLQLNAYVANTGTILLGSSGGATTLRITGGGASLQGSGRLLLSNNANNSIVSDGSYESLTNRSLIAGAGTLGDTMLQFGNLTGGVVNANGSVGLTIVGGDPNKVGADYNNGLIETTGTGGLTITGVFGNNGTIAAFGTGVLSFTNATLTNGGGSVETDRAGAAIVLNNANLSNGSLTVAAGSSVTLAAGTTDTIGEQVFNNGAIHIADGATLIAGQAHWSNTGTVSLDGASAATRWMVGAAPDGTYLNLVGHGTIHLGDAATTAIVSNGHTATLQNNNNLIDGAGTIGDAKLTLQNQADGVISATLAGGMTISTGTNAVYNAGLIASNTAGGITIASSLTNLGRLVANAGTITAQGTVNGSGVALINNASTIEFGSYASVDVFFGAGGSGALRLDTSSAPGGAFAGSIHGFSGQNQIDLADIPFETSGGGGTVLYYRGGPQAGTLTVTQGTHSTSLNMIGSYTQGSFALQSDQHGGTLIT